MCRIIGVPDSIDVAAVAAVLGGRVRWRWLYLPAPGWSSRIVCPPMTELVGEFTECRTASEGGPGWVTTALAEALGILGWEESALNNS
ncbi:hypothetical protein ACQPYK_50140 (plasmid) [Streptosporangium sp. CA-135522]|uniref:hypothetical protein n=1 Tax=Streptosporangium sp. CA-135522 TaxID=3240072 RepID=UPI003D8D49BF